MSKIIITGSTPSKKNSRIIVCRGKFPQNFPSANYTAWHKDALLQLTGKKPIKSKELVLTFFAKDNRKFDLSNKCESIMDTLVDAGLIEDDNYTIISDLHLHFGGVVGVEECRCEIDY